MVNTLAPLPGPPEPVHDTRFASPRITEVSWHEWACSMSSSGSPDRSNRRYEAEAGSSRGTSMMSMPRQLSGSSPPPGTPNVVFADELL